jgi:hypothetical protein
VKGNVYGFRVEGIEITEVAEKAEITKVAEMAEMTEESVQPLGMLSGHWPRQPRCLRWLRPPSRPLGMSCRVWVKLQFNDVLVKLGEGG